MGSQIAELSFFSKFVSVFTTSGPTNQGELEGLPNRAFILGKATVLLGSRLVSQSAPFGQTNPLPFIPWARHTHRRIGDYFSMFTPLDPLCSA